MLFANHPLLPTLSESLKEQGITIPTPIQSETLPSILEGQSVVGVAQTGSGKTLAYVLPLLHRVKSIETKGAPVEDAGRPRGLIVVPGRELGAQVAKVLKSLTHKTRVRVRTALGGSKKQIARQNVSGKFEILVATPGRLTQLKKEGDLDLTDVRMLVFDEADQLMDAGFLPVAKSVVTWCPDKVQVVLFSATFPGKLEAAVYQLCPVKPKLVRTKGSQRTVASLTTKHREVVSDRRYDVLLELLFADKKTATIVFVNTLKQAEKVAARIEGGGLSFVRYVGQMDRIERKKNLARFRNGDVNILLTTDLGGRGLDIDRVDRVINSHLPDDMSNYLHRAGRTARAGRPGLLVNLYTQRDHDLLALLKKRST